jgi:hypothetical protein
MPGGFVGFFRSPAPITFNGVDRHISDHPADAGDGLDRERLYATA